jgi:hypothetical protein
MDILIFIFAIIQLLQKKYSWVIASIIILASSFLEINWGNGGMSNFIFKHQISDVGIILYLIFFCHLIYKCGFYKNNILTRYVLLFYAFLLVSAIIDINNGVTFTDVIKYCRTWAYLSFIWIKPYAIPQESIRKSFRILLYVVAGLTIIIVYQNLTGNYLIGVVIDKVRGVKPSLFVILFSLLLLFDCFDYSKSMKWLLIVILFGSILLNLKQTYFFTVVFSVIVYLILFKREKIKILPFLKYFIGGFMVLFVIFQANENFRNRINESLSATDAIKTEEVNDNFSYRILHADERLNYIIKKPVMAIRGIGFVHEKSFKIQVFSIGLPDEKDLHIIQLDTGDIAWSIFFVRFGLVGTIIFIIFYIAMIVSLYIKGKESLLSGIFCAFFIVGICFMSFGNAAITNGYFYIMPILSIYLTKNKK